MSTADLLSIHRTMLTVRLAEERFMRGLSRGEYPGFYFPVQGMEAAAAGVIAALRPDDYYISTYRSLADVLAKGASLEAVFGELLGRATGMSRGKGGTMHLADRERGMMLTTGIVGSGTPIANGLGLAARLRGDDRVTGVSFGDGATSIGALHEALNLASLWDLPVIFVCHNNLWGECTPLDGYTRTARLAERAAPFGIPGVTVDGTDVLAVYDSAAQAADRARRGDGPTFLEVVAPRILGHYFGDAGDYMDEAAVEQARANDPVPKFGEWLVAQGHLSRDELEAMTREITDEVEEALAIAVNSDMLPPDELHTDVFAPGVDTPQ
ncbi:MAG: thiamine pyrophosphate-dependent dehydrogenase E1 component subunit alpha [Actinomycetota bacterium]